MSLRIPASTVLALGVLAGGLIAVAAVQAAQYGGNLAQERLTTQQRTQSQNQLRSDQLSGDALQRERLMTQQRSQTQQMLRDGSGPSGTAAQHQFQNQYQFQNQQRQQLQSQPRYSPGSAIPGGSGSGARMGTGGGRR